MTKTQSAEELAQAVAQGIAASPTTSATQAGQTERASADREALVEAINQVFALFRLNYANQFYAAWPDAGELNQVKRLWLDALKDYPPEMILRGARYAIEHSEYLPNLSRMHDSCQQSLSEMGVPTARDAYLEACNAPSPKAAYAWSHPAVFHAGAATDWYFLANNPESMTWPVFRERYLEVVLRATQGENLTLPAPAAEPETPEEPLSLEERKAALAALREETGL